MLLRCLNTRIVILEHASTVHTELDHPGNLRDAKAINTWTCTFNDRRGLM